ncbi:MAG: hypothetical protein M5U09_19395 [Gammaproteobacteria bacterium]|nr:hypothetical protein [Gammaproteobacteria bacterium]
MSILGGIVGLGAGYGGAMLLARLTGWNTVVPLSAVLIAVGFGEQVCVLRVLHPARKGGGAQSGLEALRYE